MFKHLTRLMGRCLRRKPPRSNSAVGDEALCLSIALPVPPETAGDAFSGDILPVFTAPPTAPRDPIRTIGSDETCPTIAGHGVRLEDPLDAYLIQQGNSFESVAKLRKILEMREVILETGCGGGEVAWQIASGNPQVGVVATDKYDLLGSSEAGSFYRKVAQDWKNGCLEVQQALLPNLVVLKAEAGIIQFLPKHCIDSILLVNPEPSVAQVFVESLESSPILERLKPGSRNIVIKPFSREMNVMSCGGFEFDHSQDWSCGLGFILGSSLPFSKASPVQWSVDLSKASPYCKNSTQHCVYIYGDATAEDTPRPFQVRRLPHLDGSKKFASRRLKIKAKAID